MKLLEILGIFLSIIQALTGILSLQTQSRLGRRIKGLIILVSSILIIVIILMLSKPAVTITDPSGLRIAPVAKICGTIQNQPSNRKIFLLVKTKRYYPFVVLSNGSQWESDRAIPIGNSKVRSGELILVSVPADSVLQRTMGDGKSFESIPKDMGELYRRDFKRDPDLPPTTTCTSR